MEKIEGEMTNFIVVWTLATASLCYSYTIGKVVPEGRGRLVAILPPTVLLLVLPLRLTSALLVGPSSFFLSWLSTFKLLLFAFGKGPLSSNPPLSLYHFVLLASLPIKFQDKPLNETTQIKVANCKRWPLNYDNIRYAIMVILCCSFIPLYEKKESLHPMFTTLLYTLHMYTALEIILALVSAIVRKLVQIQLEPPFEKPYLSISPQEFWGRRWNIMVSRILHPAVYAPMVNASSRVIGRKWASLPAVVVTFAVSGLMHELIFYYMKREKPTWEAWEPCWDSMCFFLLHGVCVAFEIALKKTIFKDKWQLPRWLSRPLTVAFVVSTALCLFVPSIVRTGVFVKTQRESVAILHFVRNVYAHLSFAPFPFEYHHSQAKYEYDVHAMPSST